MLLFLILSLTSCNTNSYDSQHFTCDSQKYEWLTDEDNSGEFSNIFSLDTTMMIISEEDSKPKKCRFRSVVLEGNEPKYVNLLHFSGVDTTISYNDKICLILFDVDENNYHDTVVVDRAYMTEHFHCYSDGKRKYETDSVFFKIYTQLEPPTFHSNGFDGAFDFAYGIPKTRKIYGNTLIFYSAGYTSVCNNMVNTLRGE